jgi:hypothetical protein
MYLFHLSTCFKRPSVHHQENQLYQYIIWYVSHCVGDSLVCRSGGNSWPAYQTVTYTVWYIPDDVLIQLILLMMSTVSLETCREVKKINTLKKCVKLVTNKNCTEMQGQQNMKYIYIYFFFSVLRTRMALPVTFLNKDLAIFVWNHAATADIFFANVGPGHLPMHRGDTDNVFEGKRCGAWSWKLIFTIPRLSGDLCLRSPSANTDTMPWLNYPTDREYTW